MSYLFTWFHLSYLFTWLHLSYLFTWLICHNYLPGFICQIYLPGFICQIYLPGFICMRTELSDFLLAGPAQTRHKESFMVIKNAIRPSEKLLIIRYKIPKKVKIYDKYIWNTWKATIKYSFEMFKWIKIELKIWLNNFGKYYQGQHNSMAYNDIIRSGLNHERVIKSSCLLWPPLTRMRSTVWSTASSSSSPSNTRRHTGLNLHKG